MKKITSTCPAQAILEFLGRQHMLTIIHTLGISELGFGELQQKTNTNTRTLTKRLQELQNEKIITVAAVADGRCKNYKLTQRGVAIEQVLNKLPN